MINPEVRDIIEAELQPGEELLWAEPYKRSPLRTAFDIYFFAISLITFLFLTAWIAANTYLMFLPDLGAIRFLSLVFIILGIGMFILSKNLWLYSVYEFFGSGSRIYALTDHRAIFMESRWPNRLENFRKEEFTGAYKWNPLFHRTVLSLKDLQKTLHKNPIKNLWSGEILQLTPSFENLTNLDHVETLILKHFHLKEQSS